MRFVLEVLLIFLAVNAILADKALNILPLKELKRRARGGHNKREANFYKVAAYGRAAANWFMITGAVSAGLLLVFLIPHTWLAIMLYSFAMAWAIRGWQPPHTTNSLVFSMAAALAPINYWVLARIAPLFRLGPAKIHLPALQTKVYEREDLIDLLHDQPSNPDNRISDEQLKIAAGALTFGDKKVADVLVPLRKVRLVTEDELVGPMLMDELHKTGFSRFPVAKVKSSTPELTGTLYLRDIILHEGGRVRDVMNKKVYYINEAQSLRDALVGFLKTHHHQFVVVNNFEEIVGVLSLEDVLEQILGDKIVDEFDRYDDLRAVAGLEAKKEQAKHEHVEPTEEIPEQTIETVVE